MSYALFAQRKLALDGLLTTAQAKQAMLSDQQLMLATNVSNMKQQLSSIQASQSSELAELYNELSSCEGEDERDSKNAEIKEMEQEFQSEINAMNNKINRESVKENTMEMEVKALDTKVTKYQKELEKIEEAESKGMDNAQPKYKGLG